MSQAELKSFLGIRIGGRELGLAVVNSGELTYYAVKSLTRRSSQGAILHQVRSVVLRVLWFEQPEAIVLGSDDHARSALLSAQAQEIGQLARKHRLSLVRLSRPAVHLAIADSEKASKLDVREALIIRFSELSSYRRKPTQRSFRYWQRMFDAVAIAVAASDQRH